MFLIWESVSIWERVLICVHVCESVVVVCVSILFVVSDVCESVVKWESVRVLLNGRV